MEAKVYSDNANRNDFLYIDYTYAVPKVRGLQLTFLCILTRFHFIQILQDESEIET